jgi:hypothetical protein
LSFKITNYLSLLKQSITWKKDEGNLQQYILKDILIEETTLDNGDKGVQVEIILERRIFGIVLTTYFPTILMNIINQSTMYLECEQFFEAILTTNITCMTVLASLYILFSSVVPQTSYVKLVDIWFLFNLVYPFILILNQIFIQKSRLEEKQVDKVIVFVGPQELDESKFKINKRETKYLKSEVGLILGKIVLPILGISFVVIYFVFGILLIDLISN